MRLAHTKATLRLANIWKLNHFIVYTRATYYICNNEVHEIGKYGQHYRAGFERDLFVLRFINDILGIIVRYKVAVAGMEVIHGIRQSLQFWD